jgi:beta-lactam-binding protein with PASTA domain
VNLPNLVGQSLTEASTTLTALGLKVSKSTELTVVKSENAMVLSQTPASGKSVPAGSTVTLVVGRYSASATGTETTTGTGTTATATQTTPVDSTTTASTPTQTATTPSAEGTTTTTGLGVL